ncbi:hypothetical protein [Alcaligenes faecalis]|nr:hypothetical protein [Alcaligenes faecalis]
MDGVLSSKFAGPVNVTLGKIGDVDLAEDLDLASVWLMDQSRPKSWLMAR